MNLNPIEKLCAKINAFEEAMPEKGIVTRMQVPRAFVRDIVAMNAEEWRDYSNGFISDDDIDDILNSTTLKGASGLTGFKMGCTTIEVADCVEDDCSDFRVMN